MTENLNPRNNNKRTIRFQILNIDLSRTIKFQVRNIDSNINSSLTRQKRAKKTISIKKSEEFFATFMKLIGYGFGERNQINSLSENNSVY